MTAFPMNQENTDQRYLSKIGKRAKLETFEVRSGARCVLRKSEA